MATVAAEAAMKREAAGGRMEAEVEALLYPELDDRVGVAVIVVTALFFFAVSLVLRLTRGMVVLSGGTPHWRFRNLAVSWVNAVLSTLGVIYCYFQFIDHVHSFDMLFDLRPQALYVLTAFVIGYLVYDMLDYVLEGEVFKQWEVTLHHLTGIVLYGYHLVFHCVLGFSIMALSMEFNSIFLHGRKLMQMLKVPFDHWAYRAMALLNLASFAVFRGGTMVLVVMATWSNYHRFTRVYAVLVLFTVFYAVVLNPVLFYRLLKSDVLRRRKSRPPASNGAPRDGKSRLNGGGGSTGSFGEAGEKNGHLSQNGSSSSPAEAVRDGKSKTA